MKITTDRGTLFTTAGGRLNGKRGPRWFQRMWAARRDTVIREIRNYSRRLMP